MTTASFNLTDLAVACSSVDGSYVNKFLFFVTLAITLLCILSPFVSFFFSWAESSSNHFGNWYYSGIYQGLLMLLYSNGDPEQGDLKKDWWLFYAGIFWLVPFCTILVIDFIRTLPNSTKFVTIIKFSLAGIISVSSIIFMILNLIDTYQIISILLLICIAIIPCYFFLFSIIGIYCKDRSVMPMYYIIMFFFVYCAWMALFVIIEKSVTPVSLEIVTAVSCVLLLFSGILTRCIKKEEEESDEYKLFGNMKGSIKWQQRLHGLRSVCCLILDISDKY